MIIPDKLLCDYSLSDASKVLYYILGIYKDKDDVCRITVDDLSSILGKDNRSTQRRLKELLDFGYISKVREGAYVFPVLNLSEKNSKSNLNKLKKSIPKGKQEFSDFLTYWNDIYRSAFLDNSHLFSLFCERKESFSLEQIKEASLKRAEALKNDKFWNDPERASLRNSPYHFLRSDKEVETWLSSYVDPSSEIKPFIYD